MHRVAGNPSRATDLKRRSFERAFAARWRAALFLGSLMRQMSHSANLCRLSRPNGRIDRPDVIGALCQIAFEFIPQISPVRII